LPPSQLACGDSGPAGTPSKPEPGIVQGLLSYLRWFRNLAAGTWPPSARCDGHPRARSAARTPGPDRVGSGSTLAPAVRTAVGSASPRASGRIAASGFCALLHLSAQLATWTRVLHGRVAVTLDKFKLPSGLVGPLGLGSKARTRAQSAVVFYPAVASQIVCSNTANGSEELCRRLSTAPTKTIGGPVLVRT
jgi:hypothetical protein